MPLTQLAKPQWQAYFDHVSRTLGATQAQIEVTGLGLGDQFETHWVPLLGLSYDPRNDLLAVVVEGLEHLIHHPKQIHVDHDMEWLHSVEAVDAEGNRHIIVLKDSLVLPAPFAPQGKP
jgi:hypothetical protein